MIPLPRTKPRSAKCADEIETDIRAVQCHHRGVRRPPFGVESMLFRSSLVQETFVLKRDALFNGGEICFHCVRTVLFVLLCMRVCV